MRLPWSVSCVHVRARACVCGGGGNGRVCARAC